MKKLIAVLGLVLSFAAQASEPNPYASLGKSLQREIQARKAIAAQPLLEIQATPAVQGSEFNVFARSVSEYDGSYVALDATLDGSVISLDHPARDLWSFTQSQFESVKSHTLVFTVSLENAAQADQIGKALAKLAGEIQALQTQIASTTDPNQLSQLNAQLSQDEALQSQLSTSLASLKNPIGTQSYRFDVQPAPAGSATFPSLVSVNPILGATSGGTPITLTGTNFAAGATVTVGNVACASVNVVSATSITCVTPAFSADGAKDIVVALPLGTGDVEPKTALLRGAFYSTSSQMGGLNIPVAVAGATQYLALGSSATLNGTASVGPTGDALAYAWSLISKPAGSNLPAGTTIATTAAPSVTPDYPGNFVYQLVVTDTTANVVSAPSLTVVTANLPSATLTATAPAIATIMGGTATSQIAVTNANNAYVETVYVLSQAPLFGAASVSPTGLITYHETSTAATVDQIGITIVTSGNQYYTLQIPITISPSTPPTAASIACSIQSSTFPVLVGCSPSGVSAPNGSIASYGWQFGDGTPLQYAIGGGLLIPGQLKHNYYADSNYFVNLALTDNLGSSTDYGINLTVQPDTLPVSNFTLSASSGAAPFTVTANATGSHALQGSLFAYRWVWGDGTIETGGGPSYATRSHTYTVAGTYNVELWVIDSQFGNTIAASTVYVGVTPPAAVAPPAAVINVTTPREQTVGTSFNFDGSTYSFDTNSGGAITSYAWDFGDMTSCTNGCTASTGTASHAYTQPRNAIVSLSVTNAGGATSIPVMTEVLNVVSGHAPRSSFLLSSTSGVAPLAVTANGTYSYSVPGSSPIASYSWVWGDGTANGSGATASHTYTAAGTYFPTLTVTDGVGNMHSSSQLVSVSPSLRLLPTNRAPGGGNQNAELMSACGMGSGIACDALAKVYARQGDLFTSKNLEARACKLGYLKACSAGAAE